MKRFFIKSEVSNRVERSIFRKDRVLFLELNFIFREELFFFKNEVSYEIYGPIFYVFLLS